MVALLACWALTAEVQTDPVARNAAFMKNAKTLSLEFTVREPNLPGAARATLLLQSPATQKFSCDWTGERFRYVQSAGGTISIRDDWKLYEVGPTFPILVQPPAFSGYAELAYPGFLLYSSLAEFDKQAPKVVKGTETVQGRRCDIVEVVSQSEVIGGTHRFWIDEQGRVLRWHRVLMTQNGPLETTADYTKVEANPTVPKDAFAIKLPLGYMPTSISGPSARTVMLGNTAPLGTWKDARTNKREDVAKLAASQFVAIVFTAPDCAISKGAEPFLNQLRRALKPKGCALIEVSLGPSKPDAAGKDKDRRLFWDEDGKIEEVFSPPGTPYMLLVDKKGVLVRAWQGYAKSQDAAIQKHFLTAFD